MATRTVSHLALCCLIAAIVLTNATSSRAAPAEQVTCAPLMTTFADGHVELRCPDGTLPPTGTPVATATTTPPATATSLPTGTATPVVSVFTNGIFEDGALYDPDDADSRAAFTAMLVDIKGRGFTALMVGRGDMQRNSKLLTLSDQVGGLKVYIGAPQEILVDRCCWNYTIPPDDPNGAPDFERAIAYARGLAGEMQYWFESHPSFGGYYLYDEPDTDYGADAHHPSMAATLAQALLEQDPGHVRFIVNNSIDQRLNVYDPDQMSPFVVDPYPFNASTVHCDIVSPQGPFAGFNLNQFYDELLSRSGKKPATPMWVIGQTHGGGQTGLRAPDAEEVRAQYRVAREHGASAIFWFTYSSQQGWTGLKDNPTLMSAVTALAQGNTGGASCGGSGTPTPVSTTVATSTATLPPTATPPPTPGPTGNGVPSVPLNYSETVDQFWARHPANSSATGYVASLGNPQPVINVPSGANLQQILDTQCPQAGCTLRLLNGNHGRLRIIGRSNVHIRGESRTGTHFQGVQIASCDGAIKPGGSYTILDQAENASAPWALDCLRNRQRNFSVANLTFDGQGAQLSWDAEDHLVINSGLVARTVLDVWVEDVDVTGYAASNENTPHDGIIMGNYEIDNFLVRRAHFLNEGKSHIFADGCRACAVLDSIFPFAGSGAAALYTNDDATNDLNRNGLYDEDELRLARYIVLRGNTVAHNNAFAFAVQGQYALIENNTTTGFHRDFALLQTRRTFNHPAGTYVYKSFGHIVRNNTIQSAMDYVRFDMPDNCADDAPNLTPDQCLQAGQITVTGNHMIDKGRLLGDVLMWTFGNLYPEEMVPWPANYPKHAPIVISGNT